MPFVFVMDELSLKFFDILLDRVVWELSYSRMLQTEKYSTETIDTIMCWLFSDKYKHIAKDLCEGTYKFSIPQKVQIAKTGSTKKRIVYKYPETERYLLSILYRAMSIVFADKVSEKCFSYKRGICTLDALNSILGIKGMYGVKVDIHAYFNSVSREYLHRCITELFDTSKGIGKTIAAVYMNDKAVIDGAVQEEYKALIPGTAIGSFFANYCLHDIDTHFESLGIPYARYSDDIILFDKTEEKVKEHIAWLLNALEPKGLTINEDKFKYFKPTETVDFLGLCFGADIEGVDISKHSKDKVKRVFKRWCRKARKRIEMDNVPFETAATHVLSRFNSRLYKTYVNDTTKFGWAYYVFRYITDTKSLKELDTYCMDTLRYLKTGRYAKSNKYALSADDFRRLGYVSFVEMYELFRTDFGYYCDVVTRL